ncbi:MAG TPA: Uma2 family endonuclease [Thermoanaerobaculia bacterium]|nr:Uma2 family endonuclease [Thermoanaerobaculia bacterium]
MGNRENTSSPVRLTYADLRRLPDDGMRHELIDGEHYVTPAPRPKHQRVSGRLHLRLGAFLEEHPLGRVYYAPLDVVLTDFDCVEPDLLYVSRECEQRQMTEDYLEGAPDLVVEILSPSTKRFDQGVKHRLYERFGVSEYWIVDPEQESVSVYRQEDDRLQLTEELFRRGGTSVPVLSTPLLPGLAIPLDKIFD